MYNSIQLGCLLVLNVFCIHSVYSAPRGRVCVSYVAPDLNSRLGSDEEYDEDNENSDAFLTSTVSSQQLLISGDSEELVCPNSLDFCYTVWKVGPNDTITIERQGCWDVSDKQGSCHREQCISDEHSPTSKHRFCCCSEDLCNKNMTSLETFENAESVISSQTDAPDLANLQPIWSSPLIWICSVLASIITVAILLFLTCRNTSKPDPEHTALVPSGPGYSSNLQNVDNLKVCSMIGHGKYGTVWKGLINEQPVAVKIFPSQYKQYFINERNIYSLPHMDSPSLLTYFGCDERKTLDDNIEFFLVLSLAPLGCLQDWLIQNTSTYAIFCKMAKSLTRGLSHLHTEIGIGDDIKPCICHRDLNTRNILVKSDLSCCIADFGFALKTNGSKYEYKGEVAVAETKSINEVGTLRYMAPEILEGAVNLRDCETALKQTDVYALGLVLWELSVRCHEMYPQNYITPEYKAPYEEETGKNPTFEQMQVLVSKHKARPLFPSAWGGGQAGKITRDTCEDCWDHDAEARLTALCVEERIQELSNLRPRCYSNRGSSPPLSANNLASISFHQNSHSISDNAFNTTETGVITPPNQIIPNGYNVENPAIAHMPIQEKNHFVYTRQIQPFQGRNPCQERNLNSVIKQNHIPIEKSKKHSFVEGDQEKSLSSLERDVSVEELISSNSGIIREQTILGEGFPKQNNTDKKLRGWYGVRALIQKKLFRKTAYDYNREQDEKSNLVDNGLRVRIDMSSPTKDTRVNLIDCKNKYQNGVVQTRVEASNTRPSNLDVAPITVRVNQGAPENSDIIRTISDELSGLYRNFPECSNSNGILMNTAPKIVISRSANAVKNLNNSCVEEKQIKRQRSLEVFREVFGNKGSIERLRDPSQRVKTPGDVPPSVRKVRASKTLSLYDDRMMDSSGTL